MALTKKQKSVRFVPSQVLAQVRKSRTHIELKALESFVPKRPRGEGSRHNA